MTPVRMREKESARRRVLISRKQRPLEAKKTQIITILYTGESILTYLYTGRVENSGIRITKKCTR